MRKLTHLIGCTMLAGTILTATALPMLIGEVRSEVPLPFGGEAMLDDRKQVLVVFAGFPGCSDICPTTLGYLGRVHDEVDDKRLSIAFLNILLDTPVQYSLEYAQAFHSDFIAYSPAASERDAIYRQMGLLGSTDRAQVQNHSGNTFVYQREGERWLLKHVYAVLPAEGGMASDINQILEQLHGRNDRA